MSDSPYSSIEKKALSTPDLLAVGRNKLAVERTMLSYIRTFLSFVVAGVSLIQFFNVPAFVYLGYVLIPAGFVILLVGAYRFSMTRRELNRLLDNNSEK